MEQSNTFRIKPDADGDGHQNRSQYEVGRVLKAAKRRRVLARQSGREDSALRNNVTQFAHRHTFELAASLLAIVMIGGGIAGAARLA
jgi:hypothetical protein